jgi:glycosyltransferase involved in cell wall biosynthesis
MVESTPMSTSVSVIVPTYNGARFILETIDSILSQTYSPQEILLIDDGSLDNTQEVVANFHPKVKYHRIPNSGVCNARNVGVTFASSPYVAFCDHDDLWRSDKLEKQMSLHNRFPEMQYSFTNFAIISDGRWSLDSKFDDAPKDFFEDFDKADSACAVSQSSLYDRILQFQPIFPSTVLIKKTYFEKLGGFDESFGRNPSEDLEFTLRCVQNPPIGIVSEPVVGIRKHQTNFSGDHYATALGRIEIFDYALNHHSVAEPTKALLLKQIAINRVDASYEAFELRDFDACTKLLSGVPAQYLPSNTKIKLAISKCPTPVAKLFHSLLARFNLVGSRD